MANLDNLNCVACDVAAEKPGRKAGPGPAAQRLGRDLQGRGHHGAAGSGQQRDRPGYAQVTGDRSVIEWLSNNQPEIIEVDGLVLGMVDWDTAQSEDDVFWVHCSWGLEKEV
jgi:hypothetical protein